MENVVTQGHMGAGQRFRRMEGVGFAAPSGEPAADPEMVIAHGQRREKHMQDGTHRQDPLVGLIAVEGEGMSAEDLADEFREKLAVLADEYLSQLAAVRSPWLSFALVIAAETRTDAKAPLVRAV